MLIKTLNLEDEQVIPAEDNNCFGFDKEKAACGILTATKLTEADKLNCGTLRCPFYKPESHKCSIKHEGSNGIFFETKEEYTAKTGYKYLTPDNMSLYENYPHASENSVESEYRDYIKASNSDAELDMILSMLPYFSKAEILQKGAELGIFINSGLRRAEMASVLEDGLYQMRAVNCPPLRQ